MTRRPPPPRALMRWPPQTATADPTHRVLGDVCMSWLAEFSCITQRRPLGPVADQLGLGPAGVPEASSQIGEQVVGDIDRERLDVVGHFQTVFTRSRTCSTWSLSRDAFLARDRLTGLRRRSYGLPVDDESADNAVRMWRASFSPNTTENTTESDT